MQMLKHQSIHDELCQIEEYLHSCWKSETKLPNNLFYKLYSNIHRYTIELNNHLSNTLFKRNNYE